VGSKSARKWCRWSRRPADRLPRRGTDRLEDGVAWLLVAAALLLVPLIGTVAAGVHHDGVLRAAVESAERRQVPAEVVAETPGGVGRPVGRIAGWTGPDGQPRTGRVPLAHPVVLVPALPGEPSSPGTGAVVPAVGQRILIWIDARGAVTRPPATPDQAVQAAVVVSVALAVTGLVAIGGIWLAVRALTARLNAARWEREWARVGPRWSRRVH
jgi:hypothetical protein